MIKNVIILIIIIIIQIPVFSQKENWLWYNGYGAMTFNTPDTSPKYIFDFPQRSEFVSLTVSDKYANCLFYSDGDSVWNKKHKLMPNGDFREEHCCYGALACDKPGNKNEYILFNFSLSGSYPKLYYSIISMALDNGLGDVKIKKVLLDSNVNFFNIVYHPNGIDLWIITYSNFDSFFKAYLMTKDGTIKNPIMSRGKTIPYVSNRVPSNLIISPDNKKIIKLDYNAFKKQNVDLYYFDDKSGKIKFITNLVDTNFNNRILSTAKSFSSNSKLIYFYISGKNIPGLDSNSHHCLLQLYLQEKDTMINIHRNIILFDSTKETNSFGIGDFWLAPNKKFYFKYNNTPYYIGEISFPDSIGDKCGFNPYANRTPFHFPPYGNAYFPCYYCFYAGVKEPICEGDTIFLEGNLSARFVEPEFYWTGPNGFTSKERSPIIPNAEKRHSGLYKLYVKADTTLLYDSVFVYIFDRQKAKIKINGSQQLCKNGVIELQSEYKDKSYSYLWSNGSTKDKISVNKGGIYKLYVTNEAGCVGVDSIEIYDPAEVKLKSDKEGLCYGETAKISFETDFKNLSFVWSNRAKDSSITVSEPGIYKLYYEYGNCRDSQEIKINDYGKIGAKIIGDSVICKGDSVWLQAYPQLYNFRYLWSTGSKEYEIKESGTKNIYLIIENQYGCKDTAYLSLREIESKNTKISGGIGICEGQKKKLKAITPTEENIYSYKWSTGDTTKEIIIEKEGIYHLEVTLNGKCKVYDTIRIVKAEPPKPTITGNEYICPGSTDVLICKEEFTSYQWNTGDTTKQISIDKSGIYSLTVIDSNGCEASASLEVKEYDVKLSGFIDRNFGKITVGRFSTNILQLKNESNSDLEIINIFTKNSPDVFEIETNPVVPLTLQQGEVLEISINFKPNQVKVFKDSIIIITGKPCKDMFLSQVTGEGIKMAISSTVWLPDTTTQIGTKNFRIPIRAKLNQDTSISNLSYSTEVRFDARYYLPESITEGFLEKNTKENNERVLKIRGDNKTITGNETTLTEITGLVLLGKPEPAKLKIISFDWNEPEISVAKEDGSLTVTGVCNQGFSNLVISNNLILEIVGNPAKEYIEIIYNFETGLRPASTDEMNIYNILGECVLSEKIHPITQSYRMNIEHLPSGIYFVRLGNWVGRFVKIE